MRYGRQRQRQWQDNKRGAAGGKNETKYNDDHQDEPGQNGPFAIAGKIQVIDGERAKQLHH